MTPTEDDAALREILAGARTIAVIGYSDKAWRPSHSVTDYLVSAGYTIYRVNPECAPRAECECYPDLASVPGPVDIVDVFRRPEHVPAVAEQAIAAGARVLWLQLGVVNDAAARQAEAAGLRVVMDHCIAVDHQRLLGQ